MLELIGIIVKGVFYGLSILFMAPVLMLFRADQRGPSIDDGFTPGYDEPDDPGQDVDV